MLLCYTIVTFYGANEVVIYNFLALITIDTNINQFIKVINCIKLNSFYTGISLIKKVIIVIIINIIKNINNILLIFFFLILFINKTIAITITTKTDIPLPQYILADIYIYIWIY